jgi:glyoxylase-like metal-dependent hydrolase (beta-lactamase superfamily II)
MTLRRSLTDSCQRRCPDELGAGAGGARRAHAAFRDRPSDIWDWGDGLTIVDSGIVGSAGAILEAVEGIGRRSEDVREIVLTHYHDDHRGGAAELARRTGASVIAHRADAPVVRGEQPQLPPILSEHERPIAEGVAARMSPDAVGATKEPRELETLARLLVASTLPPVPVDREVLDGDAVGKGGSVIHIPGHTAGSIAVLVPALGVLFTGDTLAWYGGNVIPGVFNVDTPQMLRSIRVLAGRDFEAACFGHGAPIVEGASRQVRTLAEALLPG